MDPETCPDGRTLFNEFFRLEMDQPVSTKFPSPFGIRYNFSLQDALDSCPEYIVPFGEFCRLAAAESLELILEAPLSEFFLTFSQIPEYAELMKRMNVVDAANGDLMISEGEREVTSLYLAFAFRKN